MSEEEAVGDPRRLSLAEALSAVRAASHTASDRKLQARLRRAVQDRYRRTSPKRAWL